MNKTIEEIHDPTEKSQITERILRMLPDWFELEDGILSYVEGARDKQFFVAMQDKKKIGFISVEQINQHTSEIYVMAIDPDFRGMGFGRILVDYIWNNRDEDLKFLIVKTLDESSGDKYYVQTRKFYLKMGFLPLFSNDEIWGQDNPCLVMARIS